MKKFVTVIVLFIAVIFLSFSVYANPDDIDSDSIKDTEPDFESVPLLDIEPMFDIVIEDLFPPDIDEFSVTGVMPVVIINTTGDDALASAFQDEINLSITHIIEDKLEEGIKNRVRGVTFSYEHISDDIIESIVIYTSISAPGHTRQEANSVNFYKTDLRFAGINTILGFNGVKLINSYIKNLILTDAASYNSSFISMTEEQAFCVTNSSIHLFFNSYEITRGSPDIKIVSIPIDSVSNYEIEISSEKTPYQNLAVQLPLREVCEFFGFDVVWQGVNQPILITRGDTFKTEIIMDVNEYKKGLLSINLESPPLLIGGMAFAPITFFEEILSLCYYVSDTSVTVSDIYFE